MEIANSVDQGIRSRALAFLHQHRQLLATQGSIQTTWRGMHGPYFALVYRAEGRQKRLYLGADKTLAGEVEQELVRLQASHRDRRQRKRCHRIMRSELLRWKAAWARELKAMGLRLKGYEVRGWRMNGTTPINIQENHSDIETRSI